MYVYVFIYPYCSYLKICYNLFGLHRKTLLVHSTITTLIIDLENLNNEEDSGKNVFRQINRFLSIYKYIEKYK